MGEMSTDRMAILDEQPEDAVVEEDEYIAVMDAEMDDGFDGVEEEVRTGEDGYGGMQLDLYEAIVEFKKSGVYPSLVDPSVDRSAHCHWRFRCNRFMLDTDEETLLYYNPGGVNSDGNPKIVVKKGEVKHVLERIHTLIGHLGMKRTQMAVMKKLYWRSVRNDVRNFVNNCDFCVRKKMDGKKIVKAPIDITSDDFDIDIRVRPFGRNGERLSIQLVGVDEEVVKSAAIARMTSYTFRNTSSDARERFRVSNAYLKRQPYVKRLRYGAPTGYLLPVGSTDEKRHTTFMEVMRDDQLVSRKYKYEPEEEEDHDTSNIGLAMEDLGGVGMPSTSNPSRKLQAPTLSRKYNARKDRRFAPAYRPQKQAILHDETTGVEGAAGRLSSLLTPRERIAPGSERVLSSYEDTEERPEMSILPPIMFLPTSDQEVIALQKELLRRQLAIQRLQEKVLHAQYEALTRSHDVADIPVSRFEEVCVDRIAPEEEELNVIDTGHFDE